MDGVIIIGILLIGGWLIKRASDKQGTSGMNDKAVSLDNIRKGVERGWYHATLRRINGKPAIYLYGIDRNGNEYGDTYPISENDWQTLKKEGYTVE